MSLTFLLCILSLWQTVTALNIPQYHAQRPILPEAQRFEKSSSARVILAISMNGGDEVRHFEVPLYNQIPSGTYIQKEVAPDLD
jgi:hypothetical protein